MSNSLHNTIKKLGELRSKKKEHEYAARQYAKEIDVVEKQLMDIMDDQEITESKSAAGKVTLGEAVYPQVEDWDAFHQWILENQYMHFLEKRAAVLAYREALDQNIAVPGVLPFTKRKITFKEA